MPDGTKHLANSCRYERILDILNRLARGPLKVGGLHKDYGVSRRAIQRDFKAISKRHHIIDYPFGRGVKQFEEGFGLLKPNLQRMGDLPAHSSLLV